MYHVILDPVCHGLSDYHNDLRIDLFLKLLVGEFGESSCHLANKVVGGCPQVVLWVTTADADTMTKLTQLGRKYGQELVWVFSTDATYNSLNRMFAGADGELQVQALAVDYSAIILDFEAWAHATTLHIHADAPDCTYYQLCDTIITIPQGLDDKASLFLGLDIAWSVSDEDDYYGDRT